MINYVKAIKNSKSLILTISKTYLDTLKIFKTMKTDFNDSKDFIIQMNSNVKMVRAKSKFGRTRTLL